MSKIHKNILIISDIEGSSGCWSYSASELKTKEWIGACVQMSHDVDVVAKALFKAGAENIIVKDFHRTGYNLLKELIDSRVSLISGYKKGPVPGLGDPGNATGLVMLGMHAASGTNGFLSHTLTSRITKLEVNDVPISEVEFFSASLAPYGIRPIFFSGCPVACSQASNAINNINTYPINKSGLERDFDFIKWRDGLAESVVSSIKNFSSLPYEPSGPFKAEIALKCEKEAYKSAKRWKLKIKNGNIFIESTDIHDLYYKLVCLCYITPFIEKILTVGLPLYNLYGNYTLNWVRKNIYNTSYS